MIAGLRGARYASYLRLRSTVDPGARSIARVASTTVMVRRSIQIAPARGGRYVRAMDALVTKQGTSPDDVLGPSLAAAMRHPGLSVEREREIVARAQAGDVEAGGTLANVLCKTYSKRLREANDLLRDVLRDDNPSNLIAFFCECGEAHCFKAVWLTCSEYERRCVESEPIVYVQMLNEDRGRAG
jgi:hypothetical protein